ncbi:MAG: HEAT repeat domain-containing protein [Candidatus Thiodiazotropha sp. (ex Gloverina cf. vestifex)]|nr:HEAT repeat domain-containing protein [Candidatus Thiodiazotropha sp. (ex Gloverina cf. vestifex)]
MAISERQAPDALLLLATGCAHCPAVLEGLSQLLKQGSIGRLEVINIVEHPEAAQAVGTRSVPWTRIGSFELAGSLSPAELARWVELATSDQGFTAYYSHLLETQQPHQVTSSLEKRPETLPQLITLLASSDTPMTARIGIGVVLEELEGSAPIKQALPDLTDLAHSEHPNIRADAAHFLGLTHLQAASAILQELSKDANPDVREIAADSIKMLRNEEK